MVKIPPSKVDEELKKQEDDVYGTDYTEGSGEEFVDTEEMVEKVVGNKPAEGEPFDIAEEEEKDAEAILHSKPEDEDSDEDAS